MMELDSLMRTLEEAGTEQNRKIYGRHGATAPYLGVAFAKLNELKKRIKQDHALAERLWATGVAEARVLALMIADVRQVTPALLDEWVACSDNFIACYVSGLAARTPYAAELIEAWTRADDEWIAQVGWMLLAKVAGGDDQADDAYYEAFLARIEHELAQAPNKVKDAMNNALMAIGIRNERLEGLAIAVARRLGPVVVDHGETGCKTPAAEPYILKARARKQAQAAKKAAKA